ncbi:MAG: aerobic carbon-monoxide dehydrogenase large subunit [Actinomycetota bacterium]|nr:aerobic carbon-monoxide dehydrogenase large subunit [Actinomycetota bacterium]
MTATAFGAGSLIGVPVRRVEDPTLLKGEGTYIDNLPIEGALHLAFVRSPIAHATIRSIDMTDARAMPGVVGVYSADDLDFPDHVAMMQLHPAAIRHALARGKVRYVGDTVVAVVAETKAQAVDAADAVIVDYDALPAVADMESAMEADSPRQFDAMTSNIIMGAREPDGYDALAGADVIVRGRFENQRLAVVPMEGAAIAVLPGDDGDGHQLTVYLGCQMPHMNRGGLASGFGLEPDSVRLIAPHVGGSFGAKHWAPEDIVAVKIALEHGRPVKWVETRSENMISMPHGRGQVQYLELGLRNDGTIVGLRCRIVGDSGAYGGFGGMLAFGPTRMMSQGVYRIPKIAYDVAVVVTNTAPMGAYRGAGRPEAAAMLERIMDMAAAELGMDPVDIRRRNFLGADEFPYTTVTGVTYDIGDYDAPLTEALRIAGYEALRAEQAARRERGDARQLGIGISAYVEITAGGSGSEYSEVAIHADGTATIKAGTSAHGQGHATAYSQLVAGELGIPIESIEFIQSDTALVPRGGGTGGSRSLQLGGSAVLEASRDVLETARRLAAELLEAAPEDIVLSADGTFGVAGVPSKSFTWAEVASASEGKGEPLAAVHDFVQDGASFPFGAHVSVVEVDTETGRVEPIRHIAVDDCGRILNPMLVDGQVHGGLASGIAQALWEQMVYDEDGNPLTSTLAEYGIPSAAEFPQFEVAHTETPSPLNPLGAKGIGESATVGSTPAVQNAVVDALSHLGVRHIDMPLSPERVWRAVEQARAGTLPDPWREPPAGFANLAVRDRAAPTQDEEIDL